MQGNGGELNGARERARKDAPADLSRRDFAKRAGVGTAAAAGLVWAAPHISTVKYIRRAAVGSPPPTTDSSSPVSPLGGELTVSATDPCVGGQVRVTGQGFAPKTAVTVELDSSATPIGIGNSDAAGNFDLVVTLPKPGPTGAHTLRAVGVQPGGQTLTLSTPLTIKTEAECATVGGQGEPVTPTTAATPSAGLGSGDGGSLPFTGGNVAELGALGRSCGGQWSGDLRGDEASHPGDRRHRELTVTVGRPVSDAHTVWTRRADVLSRRTPRSLVLLTRDAPEPLRLEGAAIDVWDALEQPSSDSALVQLLAERFPGVDSLPNAVVATRRALERYGAIVPSDD